MGILFGFYQGGYCQDKEHNLEVQSTIGVLFFDKVLSFERSPLFGLGVGYGITHFLQLNLAIAFSPTQQRLPTATSKLSTNVYVYHYLVSLKLSNSKIVLFQLRPFVNLGTGGTMYNPQAVVIDLGGGDMIRLEPSQDHKFTFHFGGGIIVKISKKMSINLAYQRFLHKARKFIENKMLTKTVTASNKSFGLSLSASF